MMNGLRGQKQTFLSNLGYRKALKPVTEAVTLAPKPVTRDSTAYLCSPFYEAEVTTFWARLPARLPEKHGVCPLTTRGGYRGYHLFIKLLRLRREEREIIGEV